MWCGRILLYRREEMKRVKTVCQQCNQEFLYEPAPTGGQPRCYCSDECRRINSVNKTRDYRKKQRDGKACARPGCNLLFVPRYSGQLYCCRTCSSLVTIHVARAAKRIAAYVEVKPAADDRPSSDLEFVRSRLKKRGFEMVHPITLTFKRNGRARRSASESRSVTRRIGSS
jgi:hypothetical protein